MIMLRALIKFNKGLMRMPILWRLWLMLMVIVNLVVPLFFLDRTEAQVVVAVFFVGALLMTVLTGLTGFSRLLGLGHILWFPLLGFLWLRLDLMPSGEPFGIWVRALMLINAISLAIDVTDVARYIAGERDEVIEGL